MLAEILYGHGVETAVLCPGARDLPLITAFVSQGRFRTIPYVDERSAAFFALGVAIESGKPVAIVCTSGSAILNFAPAVSEAYYRHIPLIIISADRPSEWIDQNENQTLRQSGVLSNIVKASYNLTPADNRSDISWKIEREINDAMITALTGCKGPVHINVPLTLPLNGAKEYDSSVKPRIIENAPVIPSLDITYSKNIAAKIQFAKKVMIVAGACSPSDRLTKSLEKLAKLANVVIIAENLSNLHLKDSLKDPETLMACLDNNIPEHLFPDILIYFGLPLVSNSFKAALREKAGNGEQWCVGLQSNVIDAFQGLTSKIEMDPEEFFVSIASSLRKSNPTQENDYSLQWRNLAHDLSEKKKSFFEQSKNYCDLTAMQRIVNFLPKNINLQVSNGFSVRLLMSLDKSYSFHRVDCNRGVSGIDGSTSTAIGAASTFGGTTVFLSGDMSARYDIQGFIEASRLTRNFKMIIFSNGGGGIFRYISSTEGSEVRDKFLCNMEMIDWKGLAITLKWNVTEVHNLENLKKTLPEWYDYRINPSLLIVHTDQETNTSTYREFLNFINQ